MMFKRFDVIKEADKIMAMFNELGVIQKKGKLVAMLDKLGVIRKMDKMTAWLNKLGVVREADEMIALFNKIISGEHMLSKQAVKVAMDGILSFPYVTERARSKLLRRLVNKLVELYAYLLNPDKSGLGCASQENDGLEEDEEDTEGPKDSEDSEDCGETEDNCKMVVEENCEDEALEKGRIHAIRASKRNQSIEENHFVYYQTCYLPKKAHKRKLSELIMTSYDTKTESRIRFYNMYYKPVKRRTLLFHNLPRKPARKKVAEFLMTSYESNDESRRAYFDLYYRSLKRRRFFQRKNGPLFVDVVPVYYPREHVECIGWGNHLK